MPIDIYADDNESQIRFLAQRVDSLNEQVELLLEMLIVLRDRINVMEKNEDDRAYRKAEGVE